MNIKKFFFLVAKVYGTFAFLNVSFKILFTLLRNRRARNLWKHLPGRDTDITAREVQSNFRDLQTWTANFGLDNPEADLVKRSTASPSLLCNSEKSLKWLLKYEFENITKGGENDEVSCLLNEFLGDGLFVLRHGKKCPVENEKWHRQRKVAALIFTKKNFMTRFYRTFSANSEKFLQRLDKEEGKTIDLQALFFSFTMDSIEKLFMGTDVNTIEGGMSEYAKAFDKAHQALLNVLGSSMKVMIANKILLPFPLGTFSLNSPVTSGIVRNLYLRFFNVHYKCFKKHIRILDEHVLKYIKKTKSDPKLRDRKDIIANFLNSSIGPELTDKNLRDIVLNLTIAGRDTTACALSWMFFELMKNLELQEKLIAEIDGKLKGRKPSMDDLEADQLPWLNGTVYEALRLHPPVPTNPKYTQTEIEFEGTIIPKGTRLVYSPQAFGLNPSKYPNPKKFDPARWIPFKQPSLYEFPVFQAGPRFCLGKDLALFEIKLLTVFILQNFRFRLLAGEEQKVTHSLMLTQSIATDEHRSVLELLCVPHKR